ncbi:MAG TPA: DEAD/DEAH box helicase [Nocardioidaceae bacterium]|nr:DEAD/DEAH box helicase [Nocardioidaceae bacterium]
MSESGSPESAADPHPSFADLGLASATLRSLADVGYETPSPIQSATIPVLMSGRDVVGLAQTGTGKTAAFALPILSRLRIERRRPQALVLAPTRELALQVSEAFRRYAAHLGDVHVVPVYGGTGYGPQLSALKRGAQVVVGTPGRVIDHLNKGTLDLSGVDHLVLDEADEMLAMGFQEDVERILADTPEHKQVALFSATMPGAIRAISGRFLHDPAEIRVEASTVTAENTTQRYAIVDHRQKLDALTRVLEVESFDGMIVFVRTKQATEDLAERLRARGFSAAAINGDLVQAQRERTIGQLRSGSLDILVATDVAARGLDVERISHVVNFDIPHDTESYVHRIGRTGRAGRAGQALLFVTPRERRLLRAIEKSTRQPLEELTLPSVEDVNSTRVARFMDSITGALSANDHAYFRGLVERYEHEHDVPAADVAAALAVMAQGDRSFLLEPEPPIKRRPRDDGHRPPRVAGRRRVNGRSMTTYRIRVGKRHKVSPGAIVGAIANEGGLERRDFGKIEIRGDHSLVELPDDLPESATRSLARTRISGQLIGLERADKAPERGKPTGRNTGKRGPDGRKLRHKRR